MSRHATSPESPTLHFSARQSLRSISMLSFRTTTAAVSRAGVRSYAVAAAVPSGAAVKPPIALFGVDGTYASALVRSSGHSFHFTS